MWNTKSIGHSLLLLGIIVFSVCFLSGCGKEEGSGKQPKKEVRKESKPAVSSLKLIDKALEGNRIDYETALVYKAFTIFKHPDLPTEYRSDTMTDGGTSTFNDIRRNWNDLSEGTKKRLEPFFINPLDPGSILFIGDEKGDKGASLFDLVGKAYAEKPKHQGLKYFVTKNGKVKIWYKKHQKKIAEIVRDAFDKDKIYEKETTLMGRHPISDNGEVGDDGKIDFFFRKMGSYGLCEARVGGSSRKTYPWIWIDEAIKSKPDRVKDTVAHEFFHGIQYAFDSLEETWWQEATATWAEHFVYPSLDIEQERLEDYFREFAMCRSLTTHDMSHEYGAYVFPYFLAQKYGNAMIKKIWEACEPAHVNAVKAIDTTVPGKLTEALKTFAVWLYNEEPFKFFKDHGKDFPIKPEMETTFLSGKPPNMSADIQPLGIFLDRHKVDKPWIRSVDFEPGKLRLKYPYIHIMALIELKNGESRTEDWSERDVVNFCFDMPEEDLKQVTLAFVNTSLPPVKKQKKQRNGGQAPGEKADVDEEFKKMPHTKDEGDDIAFKAHKYGCTAKLDLSWEISGQGSGESAFGQTARGFMTLSLSRTERGEVSVSFDPRDEGSLKKKVPGEDIELIPYGRFHFSESATGGASGGVQQVYSMRTKGSVRGHGGDEWAGDERSKKGYGLLRLAISRPEEEDDEEITQEDIAMVPEQMRGVLEQAQAMLQTLEASGIEPNEPKKGELKYQIFLRIDRIPGHFEGNIGGDSQKGGSSEAFSEKTEIGMLAPIELEGIVKEGVHVIPLKESFMKSGIRGNLRGTLKLKKGL